MFLKMNCDSIQRDCNNITAIDVQQIGAIQELSMGQAGNAKQVFASSITVPVVSVLCWTSDTQGPVFKGIGLTNNIK